MKIFAVLLVSAALFNVVLSYGQRTLLQTFIQSLQEVNTPRAMSMRETANSAGGEDPGIDQLQKAIYSESPNFQPFKNANYRDILREVDDWLKPLVTNSQLHSAYLNYTRPPRTLDKLRALYIPLLKYGASLRANEPELPPFGMDSSVILMKLNQDVKVQLDEVTSLIVTSKALEEFPLLVTNATELPDDKRQTIIDVICQTPKSSNDRVVMDLNPDLYEDPYLYPFLEKMGFSTDLTKKHLTFTSDGNSKKDILVAGLILLQATKQASRTFAS